MTNRREQLATIAAQHGWSADHNAEEMAAGEMEFSRWNVDDSRCREYVRIELDVRGRITRATWAPARDGIGARSIAGKTNGQNKAAWIIAYFTRTKES